MAPFFLIVETRQANIIYNLSLRKQIHLRNRYFSVAGICTSYNFLKTEELDASSLKFSLEFEMFYWQIIGKDMLGID